MKEEHLKAPDAEVILFDSSEKRLSDFWKDKLLVLVFLRHFGWPFCREQVAQLRRAKSRFDAAGVQVVLVGMGTPEESTAFKERFDVPFPIISDPGRQVYRAYELKRISPLGFFSPTVALKGISAMAQGHTMGLPQGDARQLPGVFVINTDGQIIFRHYASDPADHPDPDTILAAVESST